MSRERDQREVDNRERRGAERGRDQRGRDGDNRRRETRETRGTERETRGRERDKQQTNEKCTPVATDTENDNRRPEVMRSRRGCRLTSRPFFLTQARRPSTFQEVIFMLASRPSAAAVTSGWSSYRMGGSGSFPFFAFLGVAVEGVRPLLYLVRVNPSAAGTLMYFTNSALQHDTVKIV